MSLNIFEINTSSMLGNNMMVEALSEKRSSI